jgi:hypothetical protein
MIIILCIVAANAFASLPVAVMEAPPVNPRHFPQDLNRGSARSHRASAPSWTSLERLSIEERQNSDVHLMPVKPLTEAAAAEVSVVEQFWNSGQYDAALARFRGIGRLTDPSGFFVGINWRKPIPAVGTDDWGSNVRVGSRDSAYCTAFDRNYVNGNLLVGLLRRAGAYTNIDINLSTDGGATWAETFDGNWSGGTPPSDLEGVCAGNAFFVAYPFPDINQVPCLKFDGATGQWIQFPSGAWADTVFSTAPAQITELAMCAAEEMWPGQRVYAFARTDGDSLLYAWTDGTGQPWTQYPTSVNWCSGGMIDCGVNTGYTTSNWIWASFMYKRTADTLHPAFAYMDDTTGTWHALWIGNLPTTMNPGVTSIGLWKDTVTIAYTHQGAGRFYTQAIVSYNAGAGWFYTNVPDTLANRELPNVTGTHGEGFALAHREYGSDRAIMFTRSGYDALSWTPQDSVSDHSPNWIEHPRVQWVAPGTYGVAYLSWDTPAYNSVWFNRTDWTGIAEKQPVQPTRFGLRALVAPGGARLVFVNPVAGNVQLRVFDAAGRMVESRQAFLGVGAQSLGFSSPTSGIYFAELEASGRTSVAKFFVSR